VNYQQTLDYIYSFINYERSKMPIADPAAYNLPRIARLLEILGNPQLRYPAIVVAGTKGKGSTSAMSAAMLQANGYKVGLYTQPHLHTYRERIQVNGKLISGEALTALVERLKPAIEQVLGEAGTYGPITTYEIGTALMLQHFADVGVDLAVLEIGLGGRLDAVNVVTPLVSVISSISYDHTDVLGDTLTKIAGEKAGIIKPGVPVISAEQHPEAQAVIEQFCAEKQTTLYQVGQDFLVRAIPASQSLSPEQRYYQHQRVELSAPAFDTKFEANLPLLGAHQQQNAALALGAVLLQSQQPGGLAVTKEALVRGLESVSWPSRLEVMRDEPGQSLVLIDGAHNAESAARLRDALGQNYYFEKLYFVVGSSSDKDIEGIFRELNRPPQPAGFILTRSVHPRAAQPEMLLERGFTGSDSAVQLTDKVAEALQLAQQLAGPLDLICITGSLFATAEARALFGLAVESDGRPD